MNIANFSLPGGVRLRRCKFPASWSGSLNVAANPEAGVSVELIDCDSAGTNYKYTRKVRFGTITDEETNILAGGSTNGVTAFSMKLVTTAQAVFPVQYLEGQEIPVWIPVAGVSSTITLQILRGDSASALNDNDFGIDVNSYSATGNPLGALAVSYPSVVGSASALSNGASGWVTTGLANSKALQVSVTFTPQLVGWVFLKPKLFKASTTVYVDQKPTVTQGDRTFRSLQQMQIPFGPMLNAPLNSSSQLINSGALVQ
jgi:hypothetical protein